MAQRAMLPVWFFVGVLLGIYGVLIFASGLAEWSHPPGTVLAELHAPVWWGALLAVIGGIYTAVYWPRLSKPGLQQVNRMANPPDAGLN